MARNEIDSKRMKNGFLFHVQHWQFPYTCWKSKQNGATLDMHFVVRMKNQRWNDECFCFFLSLSRALFLGLISTLFEFTYKVSPEEKALNFDRLAFLWFCVNVELALSIPHSPFRYSLPIVLICCCCCVCAESVCLTFRWQKYDIDLFDKSLLMAFAIFVSLSSCSIVQSFGSFVPQRTHISSIHDHPNEFKQTNEFK